MKTSTSWARLTGGAKIQFHQDQVHFLVIHDTALAIYEAEKLQCRSQVMFPFSVWFTFIGLSIENTQSDGFS